MKIQFYSWSYLFHSENQDVCFELFYTNVFIPSPHCFREAIIDSDWRKQYKVAMNEMGVLAFSAKAFFI